MQNIRSYFNFVMEQPLISIIFCSISPERYAKCADNIKETIGIPVELVRIDNRLHQWSIARAYNEGAKMSTSDCLLFLHEDVKFEHYGWGQPLIDKLKEPSTGVVGFIGSKNFVDAVSPWCPTGRYYGHVLSSKDNHIEVMRYHSLDEDHTEQFIHVVVVDGLGMAVRKGVWLDHPFDEEMLTGFHCYDIDFSLSIAAAGYENYAYTWGIMHFSHGSYDEKWLETTYKLLVNKWHPMLPISVNDSDDNNFDEIAATQDYDHIFRFFRRGISKSLAQKMLRRYLHKARHSKYYRSHLFVVLWTYLRKYAFKNG